MTSAAPIKHGDYRLSESGYVIREAINSERIVGRVSGYGAGTWWYQIARRPFDEPPVMGLASKSAAFMAMVRELDRRANLETIQEARAS